jgi:PBP1b-binding outer membrane lipoprotein LpoB
MIDISSKITNQLPVVKITDEIIATVNNRKSTILNMQLMVKESQKKAKENNDEYDEMAFMEKTLEMLTSPKTVKAINELDLPLPEFKIVYEAIMNAATGQSQEDTPSN